MPEPKIDNSPVTEEPSSAGGWMKIPGRCLIVCIRGYQYILSPLFPPVCRFVPTCSHYAIEAIRKHGVFRGSFMAIWRIARCHPFSRGGYDPVR